MASPADVATLEGLLEATSGVLTYAWLARELCVPAPQARALLAAYAASHAVTAHYLVCGPARPAAAAAAASAATAAAAAAATPCAVEPAPYLVSIVPASGLEGA